MRGRLKFYTDIRQVSVVVVNVTCVCGADVTDLGRTGVYYWHQTVDVFWGMDVPRLRLYALALWYYNRI